MQQLTSLDGNIRKIILVTLAVLLTLVLGRFALLSTLNHLTDNTRTHLSDHRMIFEAAVQSQVDRVKLAGEILSHDRHMKELLIDGDNKDLQVAANLILKRTNERLNALDIFLMNAEGLTIAASNFDRPKTFVGHNYGFRPYFTQAVETGDGHFLAMGVTSGILGHYLSQAIYQNGDIIGVLVVKIDLAPLRTIAKTQDSDFIVFDENNITFLSSQPDYEFRFQKLPSAENRAKILASRQYPFATLDILDAREGMVPYSDVPVMTIGKRDFLLEETTLPAFGWTIWHLSPLQPILNQAYLVGFLAMVGALFAMFLISMLRKQHLHLQRFQLAVDNLPSGLTLFDPSLKLQMHNRNYLEIMGFPNKFFKETLPNLDKLIDFNVARGEYGEGDREKFRDEAVNRIRTQKETVSERVRPNGRVIEIRSRWLDKNGYVSTYTDITDRKKIEDTAKRNTHYLKILLENLDQGISVTDENLNVVYWNKAFFKLLELPENLMKPDLKYREIIQHNALRGDYGPGDADQHINIRMEAALKFKPHHFERKRSNGQTIEVIGKPLIMDGKTIGFLATYFDITEHKRLVTSMEKLANTDGLTGLNNRRNFTNRLSDEIKRSGRSGHSLCLLIMDLDHFKAVNDTYGHAVGDQALRDFTNTCLHVLRSIDVMGRLGGEEFAVYLPDTEREGAIALAERLRESVDHIRMQTDDGQVVRFTVSIGIAVLDTMSDAETAEKLMQRADKALYEAKNLGRNQVR